MELNRTENRSEQPAKRNNHIIQAPQCKHAYWLHTTRDDAEELCPR